MCGLSRECLSTLIGGAAPEVVRLMVVMSWLLPGHASDCPDTSPLSISHITLTHPQGPADDLESATMKVTVTFGQTGVVVPCKDGWTVRDLIQQATIRYRKLLEQVCFSLHLAFFSFLYSSLFFSLRKKNSLWLLH